MNLLVTSAKGLESESVGRVQRDSPCSRVPGSSPSNALLMTGDRGGGGEPQGPDFVHHGLREIEPFKVRFIMRLIPVDRVVDTKMEDIVKATKDLASDIGQSQTFKITIEARDSPYSDKELIDAIADAIDRKVSLDSPDKISSPGNLRRVFRIVCAQRPTKSSASLS